MIKRKTLKTTATLALALSSTVMLTVPANAVEPAPSWLPVASSAVESPDTISPYYISLKQLTVFLNISNSGYSTCQGNATVESGCICDVTLELQQKNGSVWETIKDWSASGRTNVITENWYVNSGYNYRLKITAEVYSSTGRLVESPCIYSEVVNY